MTNSLCASARNYNLVLPDGACSERKGDGAVGGEFVLQAMPQAVCCGGVDRAGAIWGKLAARDKWRILQDCSCNLFLTGEQTRQPILCSA
ncbi:MAG: hypothetical protein HC849_30935 [Oscillatoriales cyanobacterium RU_3_3]|nr:hypothetical protein [Microcoleus sp. SU_5_6]NJL67366.1 hypothetical protein [Microcoleus sp. SM1_3_4]NJM63584.1 hypothetical protein [Oscillatoriales cyanobacterium RU_3_3]NJR21951.1 hypothetical protein [Richelia sp. CSU_2_1]